MPDLVLLAAAPLAALLADAAGAGDAAGVASVVSGGISLTTSLGVGYLLIRRHDAAVKEKDDQITRLVAEFKAAIRDKDERYDEGVTAMRQAVDGVKEALHAIRQDAANRDARHMDLSGKMVTAVEHVTAKLSQVETAIGKVEAGQAKVEASVERLGTRVDTLTGRVDRLDGHKPGGH